MSELKAQRIFTALQLDMYDMPWNLYHASDTTEHLQPRRKNRSRQDALRMFVVGTKVLGTFVMDDRDGTMMGKIPDNKKFYWGGGILRTRLGRADQYRNGALPATALRAIER